MEDAKRLVELVQGIPCKINLIQFNPHSGSQFIQTDEDKMIKFRNVLAEGGCTVLMRFSRGNDQMAACGQLGMLGAIQAPVMRVPEQFRTALKASVWSVRRLEQKMYSPCCEITLIRFQQVFFRGSLTILNINFKFFFLQTFLTISTSRKVRNYSDEIAYTNKIKTLLERWAISWLGCSIVIRWVVVAISLVTDTEKVDECVSDFGSQSRGFVRFEPLLVELNESKHTS